MVLELSDMVAIGILLAVMLMLLAWLITENYIYKNAWTEAHQRWYSDYDDDVCNVKDCYVCDKENK